MKIWAVMVLILTLGLGLSVGGLILGNSKGIWRNISRFFLTGVLGVIISAVTLVLIIIAIWPPYNALSVILSFGFAALIAGVLVFMRTTKAPDSGMNEMTGELGVGSE